MYFSVADDSVALFFSVMGSTAWKIYSNRAVIIVEVTFGFGTLQLSLANKKPLLKIRPIVFKQ